MKKKFKTILVLIVSVILGSCTSEEEVKTNQEIDNVSSNQTYEIIELKEIEYTILSDSDGIYTIQDINNNEGLIDVNGEVLFEPVYDTIYYTDGIVVAKDSEVLDYYCMDLDGNILFETIDGQKFSNVNNFEDGYAIVELNDGRECVIDKEGKLLLQDSRENYTFHYEANGVFSLWRSLDYSSSFSGNENEPDDSKYLKVDGTEATIKDINEDFPTEYFGENIYWHNGIFFEYDPETSGSAVLDPETKKPITEYIYSFSNASYIGDNILVYKEYAITFNYAACLLKKDGELILDFSTVENFDEVLSDISKVNDYLIHSYFSNSDEKMLDIYDSNGKFIKTLENCSSLEPTEDGVYKTKVSHLTRDSNGDLVDIVEYSYLDSDFNEIIPTNNEYVGDINNGKSLIFNDGKLYQLSVVK